MLTLETIGLIAAMPQESSALLRLIARWKRTALGSFRGVLFQLKDRNCVMVTSGMGLMRAIDATRALLSITTPDLLVSFGIAGAVSDDLNIGDVVVARSTCLLEKGLPGQVRSLATLSQAAWNAASQGLQAEGACLVPGTAITTRGSQVVLKGLVQMAHPVLEMETVGLAQIASDMGIPLVSIRSISDGPRSPIPFDLGGILDGNDNIRIDKVIMQVLRRPQMIFQVHQLMQNSRRAADNAARALFAVLNQTAPIISP